MAYLLAQTSSVAVLRSVEALLAMPTGTAVADDNPRIYLMPDCSLVACPVPPADARLVAYLPA